MLSKRLQRQRVILAALAALGIVLGALAFNAHLLDSTLQAVTYDTFITYAPGRLSNQITIVALDDQAVSRYDGVYPLPRQAWVDLLTALKPLAPRVIAFDIGFFDQSPNPDQDRALAAAITDSGNVILAMQGAGSHIDGDGAVRYSAEQVPIPILRQAAAGVGAVNVLPDGDGRLRRAELAIDTPSGRYYSLALVATARSLSIGNQVAGDETSVVRRGDTLVLPGRAGTADRVMPIDQSGHLPIYYAAPPSQDLTASQGSAPCTDPNEFCVVSLADVVAGKVSRGLIANRTILIGAHTLSGVPDNYPVPNSGAVKMWGVEIWANTAASIFANRYPETRESFPVTLAELVIATLGGILLVAAFRLYGFLAALGALVLYGYARYVFFSAATAGLVGQGPTAVASFGYLIPTAFWWVVALGYLLVEEQRAVMRTQTTFGRFVTPSIARTIMDIEESGKLALGGEEKRVTVLFGDIRGFTGLSEGMTPGVLLDTLNRYFEGIVNIVNRYEGTVNKFNGDNIMVIWGAPLPVADPARKAVQAALEIQRWIVGERGTGGPDVSFGFGINTGPVVAGFLGALGRMEYTVIGDTANVASRLTSNDIARRDQVAVSAETLSELGADVVAVDLGDVQVKGRAEPVRCYQVNSLGSIESPNPAPAPERPIGAAAVAGYH